MRSHNSPQSSVKYSFIKAQPMHIKCTTMIIGCTNPQMNGVAKELLCPHKHTYSTKCLLKESLYFSMGFLCWKCNIYLRVIIIFFLDCHKVLIVFNIEEKEACVGACLLNEYFQCTLSHRFYSRGFVTRRKKKPWGFDIEDDSHLLSKWYSGVDGFVLLWKVM